IRSRESSHPERLLLLAGTVLGLSTVFREEGYLLLCAIAVGVVYAFPVRRRGVFLLIGWLLVMIPIWVIQHHLYDHFLGLHAVIYSSALSGPGDALSLFNPANIVSNLFVYLLKFHFSPQLSLLLAMPFIAALAVGLFCQPSRIATTARVTLVICTCVTSTILLMLLLSHEDLVFDTLFTQALLPSTPFLVFFVLYFRSNIVSEDANLRFFTATTLIFLIGSGFLLNQKDVGIIWGPRHFISLYPVLVPLALIAIHQLLKDVGKRFTERLVRIAAAILVGISLITQLHGVHALVLKKTGTQAIVDSIKELDTNVLVTDVYWLPEEIASVYHEKKILMVDSDEELQSLLKLFRTKNIKTFGFVTSKYYRRVSDMALQKMAPLVKETRSVASPGMEFMSLRVLFCKL
ncbi:MAG: hypothetical protein JRI47_06410, partial [Deltaproteobacteria bacterium]|nr:hypothetical protein [Deltaproteobacteria bacterium]